MRIKTHLDELIAHLEQENPILIDAVNGFRRLDELSYKLGLLDRDESYATTVSWWPLISVLGTFSSGKSTFINHYLGQPLQATGSQAVDEKFTVICYGREETPRVLPALALDSDPRFPLYNISREIEEVARGEGRRLDSYLQLKTCNSPRIRGKILIDSPGFDADAQRTETLRITNQIIDVSDLVLVFFDARHPEPGAMRDTLEYLVGATLKRPDFNKFLYILNQIDNAAREDNPEDVFAAWRRALAQQGLTAGHFYSIYDPQAAVPMEDERLRARFEAKRNADMNEILERIRSIEIERAYRIAGELEQTAVRTRDEFIPRIKSAKEAWKRRVARTDALLLGGLVLVLLIVSLVLGWWDGLRFSPPWLDTVAGSPLLMTSIVVVILAAAYLLHRFSRRLSARSIAADIRRDESLGHHAERVANAFEKNARSWRPFVFSRPSGWTKRTRRRLDGILMEAKSIIRKLNDRYTNPSGDSSPPKETAVRRVASPTNDFAVVQSRGEAAERTR